MSELRVVYLCPSFAPYWVQIFDAIAERVGSQFTVVTQSIQSGANARLAQTMGSFKRRVIHGNRFSLGGQVSERGAGTPFGLNIAPALPLALMQLKPHIVIANNFSLWTLASIRMGYRTVIFWEGTHHTERTVRPWRHKLRRWMARRADAFVVNGSAAKAYIHESLSVPNSRIFEGGLCCSSPPEELLRSQIGRHDDGEINFICVSRLIKGKGIDHLLRAVAMARKNDWFARPVRLTIVGDGPERDALTALSRALGVDDIVSFEGAVHPDSIWQFYARANVKVLPTLQDNWPLVVLEAMTMGLPVLLSKYAGSQQDLVIEGCNGYSFDPDDHESLAKLMSAYTADTDRIAAHGDESARIVRKYDADRAATAFIQAVRHAGRASHA